MTKAELLADIEAKNGVIISTDEVEDITGIKLKRYITNVFTKGEDGTDGTPIAQKRNISWYTIDEGLPGEAAYYGDSRFQNPEDKNPTGSTLMIIDGIFHNGPLQRRVQAAMMKQVRVVLENGSATDADKYLAKLCASNPNQWSNAFMQMIATNATIQANGGAASDSDIEWEVQTNTWPKLAAVVSVDVTFPA